MTHIGYCSIFLIFFSLSLAQDKVTLNSFTSFDCSGGQTREVTFDNDWGKCQEAIEGAQGDQYLRIACEDKVIKIDLCTSAECYSCERAESVRIEHFCGPDTILGFGSSNFVCSSAFYQPVSVLALLCALLVRIFF